MILCLEEILPVLGVSELQLGRLHLVSGQGELSLCLGGEGWRWWRRVVRGPAAWPGCSRGEVHHVRGPGGVARHGALHGGQGGVVGECHGVVVVGGGQHVVVVGEGSEGVVGGGQTLHTVAVV